MYSTNNNPDIEDDMNESVRKVDTLGISYTPHLTGKKF